MKVLLQNSDPLGVDRAQIDVLEEANKPRLGCLLKGEDGAGLNTVGFWGLVIHNLPAGQEKKQ